MLRIAEFTLLAARLLLAAVFLLAGATKLLDPRGTRRALRDFGVPSPLAPPGVLLLPLLELAVAVALIPTRLAWYGAWGALALLGVFLLAVGIAMIRGRKPDCHCFGQLHSSPVGWQTLVRNVVLAAVAGWLVSRGPIKSDPDILAWIASLNPTEQKLAFVAALAVCGIFFWVINSSRPQSTSIASQLPEEEKEEAEEEQAREQGSSQRPMRVAPPPRPAEHVSTAKGIGLSLGTPAPEFLLPSLNGEKRSLRSFLEEGKDILLVFSSPFCEPCQAVVPYLSRWTSAMEDPPNIVLISRGTVDDNLRRLKGFDPSRVLLQRKFEIAEAYDCTSTPTAVLIGADGVIRSELAVGGLVIKQFVLARAKPVSTPQ